ncbi:MAG: general secretion pathway protein GspB [Ruminobacter sp.]|uniref:general secretion pathway protein GspB n=1 Tax=Ruminobacter sp. TaxID=2774296 RepID=UPI001B3D05B6|nr:general secretion pathway protein GspB [Ruminobacter sp.]MBP3748611.1 general secretion pathway protein GspB [Ruminobacter sp.]
MSLFFDADRINKSPEVAAAQAYGSARRRKGRLLYYTLLVFVGTASFAAYAFYERQSFEEELAAQKERLLRSFDGELSGLRRELTADDSSLYPYVEPSKPHEFAVKHLNVRPEQPEYVFSKEETERTGIRRERNESDIDSDVERINAALRGRTADNGSSGDEKRRVVKKDLKSVFDEAVNSTNTGDLNFRIPETSSSSRSGGSGMRDATDISMMPSDIRNAVPSFVYSSHNYSTDASKRSITLNGNVIKEGGTYRNLEVLKIAENYVVMRVNGRSFSIKAMEDYRQ